MNFCRNSSKKRMVQSGGIADIERAAKQVLYEYQAGIIGRTTLELPY